MYYVYKLNFKDNFIHFGETDLTDSKITIEAKTLFSAIVNEGVSMFGNDFAREIIFQVENDNFRISNLLPYIDDELFIPKPIISKDEFEKSKNKISGHNPKKDLKKINYIGISKFEQYLKILSDSDFNENTFNEYKDLSFGKSVNFTKNKIGLEQTEPFDIGMFKFSENAGLYFLLNCLNDDFIEMFNLVMDSLALSGIGGKRSIGCGKFDFFSRKISNTDSISNYLNKDTKHNMLISSTIPKEKEIDVLSMKSSYYTLSVKSGFKYSVSDMTNINKKKGVVYIDSGSVLEKKINGYIKDTRTKKDNHPIYNYGLSLYLSF